MKLFLLRLAVAAAFFVIVLAAGAEQAPVPTDVLKSCKNEVGARYVSVPMADIGVDQGAKTANGNYLVNWTTKPPGGNGSVGFCVVDPSFYILRFETTSGPQPGSEEVKVSPEDASRICKNQVADRLRSVPMEYITVERAKDSADGSYLISWKEQRPGRVGRSGLCTIAPDGRMRKLQFDSPPAKPAGSARPFAPAH
jgi:hypothetical protein